MEKNSSNMKKLTKREIRLNIISWQWEYNQSIKWRLKHPVKAFIVWRYEWIRFLNEFI